MVSLNKLRRLIYSPQVRHLASRLRPVVKPLLTVLGMHRHQGGRCMDPQRPTLVVVSHEASATGAPILALNLCQRLSGHANVVVLLLRGGPLIVDFQEAAVEVLQPRLNVVFASLLQRELKRLLGSAGWPRYALVNSVVSAPFIQPLSSIGIPPVTLIHEFSAYIRPLELLNDVGLWSSTLVFSSQLTRNDVLQRCPQLRHAAMAVLAQGPCQRPNRPGRQSGPRPTGGDATAFLDGLNDDTLLILGAGEVQPRKGVDLFIAVADQMRSQCPGRHLQFVWIGSGYEPLYDFSVSLWLADQIQRSGLQGQLHMLDHSPAYGDLLERANLFVMSSRLDPLPNVAIDALLAGKPVLCFERACGIADMLLGDPELGPALVAPYLQTAAMARQAATLVNDPNRCITLARRGQAQAQTWFNMDSYVDSLRQLGEQAAVNHALEQEELERLLPLKAIDPSFGFARPGLSQRTGTQQYLLAWRSQIWPRKPFAGFHPGIYRQQRLEGQPRPDPLLHYLDAGRPDGPWTAPLITPAAPPPPAAATVTVALHIHVHYPELLGELLEALAANRLRPDLFLSTNQASDAEALREQVQEHGLSLQELLVVPNRGRDLGPLLTGLGARLDRDYTIHGHLHTKKSAFIGQQNAKAWRHFLVAHLLGDADNTMADRVVNAFQADPRLGLVFADDPTCVGWSSNRAHADQLGPQLGLAELPDAFDFPVGTMFWARQGALAPLYDLGLQWTDYPPEPLGYDGTMLHAIERLLPLIAESRGFHYALSHVPGVNR
jgi:glycosyltransferase involved in cell wall biosynthesis